MSITLVCFLVEVNINVFALCCFYVKFVPSFFIIEDVVNRFIAKNNFRVRFYVVRFHSTLRGINHNVTIPIKKTVFSNIEFENFIFQFTIRFLKEK